MKSLALRAAALSLALLLAACGPSKKASAPPPPTVGVVTVQPQSVPLTQDLVGRLSAFRSADVNARVAGVLLKRNYVEGSVVKKGQLLFQIDPAPFQAAVDAAQAQLAKDRATLAQSRSDLKRFTELHNKQSIAEQTYVNQKFLVQQNLAVVQADEAAVKTARINLGYASVVSPIAGHAGEQQVTEGALVGQGAATLLATVSQMDPLYVNFTIGVGALDTLKAAAKAGDLQLSAPDKTTVAVSLPDGTPYPEVGTLDFSAPTVNPATGSVALRALLPNPQFTLRPGSYVKLQLTLGERHGAFVLPPAAVQRDIAGTYVLLVGADGKVSHQGVTTNGMHGPDWVVTAGLKPDDQVIVSGLQTVQVGGQAKTKPWEAPKPLPGNAGVATGAAAGQ